ncbi:MAG: shikimate kinase [Vampirovibrionales bacterium]|nr:shikimate kinase [Vampirovibrionales bacterium]
MSSNHYTSLTDRPIWLAGYMGCGKSTLAPLLASALALPWLDTDALLVKQFGSPIAAVFQNQGEETFRLAEAALLEKLSSEHIPRVIATGGGFLATPKAMNTAKKSGTVVYLQVPVETLWQRVHSGAPSVQTLRPLLKNETPQAFEAFKARFESRRKVYETAHVIINASQLDPHHLVGQIMEHLEGIAP